MDRMHSGRQKVGSGRPTIIRKHGHQGWATSYFVSLHCSHIKWKQAVSNQVTLYWKFNMFIFVCFYFQEEEEWKKSLPNFQNCPAAKDQTTKLPAFDCYSIHIAPDPYDWVVCGAPTGGWTHVHFSGWAKPGPMSRSHHLWVWGISPQPENAGLPTPGWKELLP